VLESQKLKMVG